MKTIIALSGSLRKGSFNTHLLKEAAKLCPSDCKIEIASIADIPLYNGDIEQEGGIPKPVIALKEKIMHSDGLLICTPEYNHGIPGVLKNVIDWLSRPTDDIAKVFYNRPTGIIGVSAGASGAATAQLSWLGILKYFRVKPYFEQPLHVGSAYKVFDQEGKIVDESIQKRLKDYVDGFTKFVQSSS